MNFKKWLGENLAGPGGGPDMSSPNPEIVPRDNANHGVGAFTTYGDNPPKGGKTPTQKYMTKDTKKKKKKNLKT